MIKHSSVLTSSQQTIGVSFLPPTPVSSFICLDSFFDPPPKNSIISLTHPAVLVILDSKFGLSCETHSNKP